MAYAARRLRLLAPTSTGPLFAGVLEVAELLRRSLAAEPLAAPLPLAFETLCRNASIRLMTFARRTVVSSSGSGAFFCFALINSRSAVS